MRGVGPGERVGIALPAGVPFAAALHACLLHGAVAVPVDLRLSAREQAVIGDGCAFTISAPLVPAAPTQTPPAAVPRRAELRHELEAVAVVIYSSGTTAGPKAIELTYGNLLWSALGSATALGLDPAERWLCPLPVAHVGDAFDPDPQRYLRRPRRSSTRALTQSEY